jgi:hypothetical protein
MTKKTKLMSHQTHSQLLRLSFFLHRDLKSESTPKSHLKMRLRCVYVCSSLLALGSSFSGASFIGSLQATKEISRHPFKYTKTFLPMVGGGGLSDGAGSELTNTLARLDQQWKIQQKSKPTSRWSKIILDRDTQEVSEEPPETYVPPLQEWQDFVYLLEPPSKSTPSCVIFFVGGAGLGQFPQIAYNEFLLRLSDRLNAAVIAAPYAVGLDHFGLAKSVGELMRKAKLHCEEDSSKLYPKTLPTYCIAHSLGCKLSSIYMAATEQTYDGIGFMSFNNFGFSQTIGMAKTFADQLQKNIGIGRGIRPEVLDQVFSFAEMAVGSIGLDFTPNPMETERLLTLKYNEEQQERTRLFVFDDDMLDSTENFVQACNGAGPDVSGLPGSHLTPVYFKLGLDELPDEVRGVAKEASGGLESASFGNEEELNALVTEVSGWILGKGPSRKPLWQTERPTISGSAEDQ